MFGNEFGEDNHTLTPDGSPTAMRRLIIEAQHLLSSGVDAPQLYIRMSGAPLISVLPTMRVCVIVPRDGEPVYKYSLDSQLPPHIVAWLDNVSASYINDVLRVGEEP